MARRAPSTRGCALVNVLACLVALSAGVAVRADAIIRTQAMQSSTIAEYFIEEDRVVLELEIGAQDLPAFENLLPDEIYEKMGKPPKPLVVRLARFFAEDLVLLADQGRPLPGRILEMSPRERVRRDEISGEPLLPGAEDPATILFVRIDYPLSGRPAEITLGGRISRQAGIGFVAYHKRIAVNDFRYLGPEQTLELDWDDPWYTRFKTRALRRAYFAPMNGFLYIEPYEVRKEIIVRPKDLQEWIDLGLESRDTIPVDIQTDLKQAVLEFLREHHPVAIDGKAVEPDYQRIDFLERTLKSSRVIDPPEELDLDSAMLGAIFVYLTEGLPESVTMDWDLFNDRIQLVPAAAVDQAGSLPTYLEPDFAVLEWQNFLKNPKLPTLTALAAPPGRLLRWASVLRWPALLTALALALWSVAALRRGRRVPVVRLVVLLLAVTAAGLSFWAAWNARLTDERARELVGGLLHNVYRAFDYRQEERIYDVLARSVEGDLLTTIYLEARRGLELASQGGARAKVKDVELVELEARPDGEGGITATATWIVSGSIGHWGHLHQRRNRYRAALDIRPQEGVWKLAGLEILEEERM